ncbi:PTS-dependent dihydroxyacetone kinase, dihydroxyacetone-binding subunit DhaK [Streptomyces sp. YIM 121038]|uniref:dihydroxyacetone kinase family protein n=1 Tax=Streptomyces sp. YIM 121038 TaxID=2136401 RepID=UPI001110310B|nr:dihydroxyacetone kinase family protein [Streptomyces sp. YIM 121038]QCX74312.1 PTS-dependent dihydroxyacetone kinase, dihydroxyacetone-binding subunit DhaK [Streptomyces sp. YIM 121038]
MSYFLPESAPVLTAARGLALAHPGIVEVNSAPLYLRARAADPGRRVALVSGGGSGHEPLHTGLLGRGGLDAVCPGEVFASPHNRQIYEASAAVAKSAGVLLIVKNYTGDVINFQIAAERLRHDGIPVATVLVDDDLATDSADSATGRRGTAATVVVEKLLGAAADRGASLQELQELGTRVVAQSRSVAVAARAQTSPTTTAPAFTLEPGVLDYGVGIHGERGIRTIARPSVDDLVRRMTDDLIDALPEGSDEVLALVNGLGATTELELHAVSSLLHDRLTERGLRPAVTIAGTYTAALDMAGFSLTLTRLDEGWVDLWTAPTETPLTLPRTVRPAGTSAAPAAAPAAQAPAPAATAGAAGGRVVLDRYAEVVAQVRDNLTKLDQLVGDGDFGDNLSGGVRRAVRLADETGIEGTAALAEAFLNDVGGTSGPLFGLFFKDLASAEPGDGQAPSVAALAEAAAAASAAINRVGGARVGDCTLVDALVPAAESLAAASAGEPTGELAEAPLTTAAQAAIRGALSTASLRPRRGRASYVGDHALGVPDPGALAVALVFTTLAEVHEPTWATRLPAPGHLTTI